MEPKERSALLCDIKDDLGGLIGASGRPEELVKLTTRVVQGVKRLLQDVPDPISSQTTASLASFIKSAQVIAKNPRGVDSRAISELSASRKDVESRLDVLEKWHLARDISVLRRSSPEGELKEVMESIVKPTGDQRRETRKASPEEPTISDNEQRLTWDLQGKRDSLLLKMEPQRAPPEVKDITESLTAAVKGLMSGAEDLTSHSDKKVPSREQLLEPMITITDKVCLLLDIVDTLFDSKYPMRAQVYSFCSALLDNVLAYGCRSKANDITSLRSIGTQTPALLNAAKVMVEQCEKKCNSNKDEVESDGKKVSPVPPLSSSPLPPTVVPATSVPATSVPATSVPATSVPAASVPVATQEPVKKGTEIYCIVCTTVAVDQKTQEPISKGAELSLRVHDSTTVSDVKQDLSSRTGLPLADIQFIQGQSELPDADTINTKSPLPFFLFNRSEPTEEERRLQRKDERNKSRMKIYDLDWTLVSGPVAVALYEYDTLGDDSNLAFDEGDVIEIIEKGGDGWWEGRIADNTGSFPASFVEEIHSRDEGVKLLEVLKRKKSGGTLEEDIVQESSKPPSRQSSEGNVSQPNILSKLKRIGGSTPDFTTSLSSSDKKNIFRKKKTTKGYANLTVHEEEEQEQTHSPEPLHKPLEGKRSKPEVKVKPKSSRGRSLHLPRVMGTSSPVSPSPTPESPEPTSAPSPQMNYKRGGAAGGKEGGAKRRPPPPRPPPFASTHPAQAAKLDVIIKLQSSVDESDETPPTDNKPSQEEEEKIEEIISFTCEDPVKWEEPGKVATPTEEPMKSTNSMEDLLNNLKEFDESTAVKTEPPYATLDEVQTDVMYEVIAPPTDTPSPNEIVTIKISDYRPDTDDELDAELAVLETNEASDDAGKKGGAVDGLLFTEEEDWNPREWAPSPEPEARRPPRSKKPPSWSYNVSNSPKLHPKTNGDKPHPPVDSAQLPVDSTSRISQGSPVPPPNVMSRPRKSPQGSPLLAPKVGKTPPPVPPPRQKRVKGGPPAPPTSKGPTAPPGRPAPPPPKPYGGSSDKVVKPHPS